MSKRLAVLAAWMFLAASAGAVPVYRASSGDRVIEITAPRPDIVRVRIGRGALAEDASWAVDAAQRDSHSELTVTETAQTGSQVGSQVKMSDDELLDAVDKDLDRDVPQALAPVGTLTLARNQMAAVTKAADNNNQ